MASIDARLAALEAGCPPEPLVVFVRSFRGDPNEPIGLFEPATGRAWGRLPAEAVVDFRGRVATDASQGATQRCLVLVERNRQLEAGDVR